MEQWPKHCSSCSSITAWQLGAEDAVAVSLRQVGAWPQVGDWASTNSTGNAACGNVSEQAVRE